MTTESKKARQVRLARDRKRKQRTTDRQRREAMGARLISLELYVGTQQALENLRLRHGFSCNAEAITRLIHAADELANRDLSRADDLFGVTGHAS